MADPVQDIIDVRPGSGVEIDIIGNNSDIISVQRDGVQIAYDRILEQLSRGNIAFVEASPGSNDWNISVRYGGNNDVFRCIAVRGNDIQNAIYSGAVRFGQGHPEWTNYGYKWIDSNTLRVQYGPNEGFI